MQITSFSGTHDFLSNFYPCVVHHENIQYPSAEHAFQAAKTNDVSKRQEIAALKTPGQAKRAGRKVELRYGWETVKLDIMLQIVTSKFLWNPELRKKLLATGDSKLIEGNDWGDVYWGVCQDKGENHLGKILMDVRDHMRGLDRWLRDDIGAEQLVKERIQAVEFYQEHCQDIEPTFTCDECWVSRICTLVFDPYNINGDCLLEK